MNSSNKVIDTLKKEELLKVANKLDLMVPKTIKKEDLKSLIINKLLNNDNKFVFSKVPLIIAIGDLHGDLEATIKALKLGGNYKIIFVCWVMSGRIMPLDI